MSGTDVGEAGTRKASKCVGSQVSLLSACACFRSKELSRVVVPMRPRVSSLQCADAYVHTMCPDVSL
eukprot:3191361-Rhodomonas_salina.2